MNYFDKTSEQLIEPPLRSPEVVMKLDRLGAFFPNRLSFTRSLVRRMSAENWLITREKFNLKIVDDSFENLLNAFLIQYYNNTFDIPSEIP